MIKMIVTDLDGTLLNKNEEISKYTISVLEKCKEKGIKIVIATARSKLATEEIINLIKPDFSILSDGALILNKDDEVINNELYSLDKLEKIDDEYMGNYESKKMNAINILSKSQDISLFEIAAFGDGENDIEMIKKCGIGIAMENSIHAVKRLSKGICGNNSEDGVAKWIKENILSEFEGIK